MIGSGGIKIIMNDNNEVRCAYCNKVLKDTDIVYYLESESFLPYCCPKHLRKNLDISEMYAHYWNDGKE